MLKDKFLVTNFPDLFRATKLPSRRVSFSTTPPSTPSPKPPSYAATVTSPIDVSAARTNSSHPTSMNSATRTVSKYQVLHNSKGQRLDAIINPPPSLVLVLRNKKLCNEYHILGKCSYNNCNYLHGTRLDEKGIQARWSLTRQTPCPSGLECENETCLFGHQCPVGACANIGNGCRFSRQMHNVDRQ